MHAWNPDPAVTMQGPCKDRTVTVLSPCHNHTVAEREKTMLLPEIVRHTTHSINQSINIFNVLGGNWDPTDKTLLDAQLDSRGHYNSPVCL